ncbi:MAG TPA: PhoH family protein, partial [Cyclobacteriaceae bacterium]|nr:PhoH family protein [Cyclobacteriaceae bacterium]
MIEKTITLDNVSLLDFLGIENKNINELASAFPKSRIVSRGNEILVKGESPDIVQITDILNSLVDHFHQFGKITEENVRGYISQEKQEFVQDDSADGIIIYGTKGSPIKAKTANQQKLVQSVRENDLVFALGPAGTGKTFVSVALAVKALKNKVVKKIIITRPAVEAGENLGFLPGDLKEKIDPY